MMRLEDIQGRQLGRYQIVQVLGRGGMAAVYRAHDTVLRRDVALKVLYPHFGTDAALIERFQREAIMAARLDHPGIVPIYDVGEGDGFVYIAMRLLHGRSLADLLREEPHLPIPQLVSVVEQIASALDYAHARGIIHRDIKAGNILLEPPDRVLLADFGIAKSLDAPGMTSTGVLIGTPDYMAPEQIANQVVDGRTDIYALGVLVFRCLTGRLPFEGSTEQVLLGHLHGTVPDPSMLVPALPVAVDAAVQHALARQPVQRPATAGAFAQALRAALGGTSPTPPPAQRRAFEGRAVVPTVAASQFGPPRAQVADATQCGPAAPPPQARPVAMPRPQPVAPPPATARRTTPLWPIALIVLLLIGGGFVLANRMQTQNNDAVAVITPTATPELVVPEPLVPTPTESALAAPTDVIVEPLTPRPTAAPVPTALVTVEPTSAPPAPATGVIVVPTAAPAVPTVLVAVEPTAPPAPATDVIVASPTPEPSPTTEPTVLPTTAAGTTCDVAVAGGFGALLEQRLSVQQRLGCATAPEQGGNVAEQSFQNGSMLWFRNTNIIYVLIGKNVAGKHLDFPPAQQSGPDEPPNATPPPELLAPVSGFGLVWDTHADVRTQLGYATAPEAGPFAGAYQPFENGVMLFSPQGLGVGPTIYVLYEDGRAERYPDPTSES